MLGWDPSDIIAGAGALMLAVSLIVFWRASRRDGANRVDALLRSLQAVHDGILLREASASLLAAEARDASARATRSLDDAARLHGEGAAKLADAIAVSRAGMSAMHEQLSALSVVKPAQIVAVLVAMRGQARMIDDLGATVRMAVREVVVARGDLVASSQALAVAGEAAERVGAALSLSVAGTRQSLEALIDTARDDLGEAAAQIMENQLEPVRDAATEHALWLRASLARMRRETEALIGAQRAADAVRSLTAATEAQLHELADAAMAGVGGHIGSLVPHQASRRPPDLHAPLSTCA